MYAIKFWVFYPNYRANGTIYIAKFNFAIHKLEYTMYDDKEPNKTGEKNKHGHKQKVIFDITTDYRKIEGKMYLNYISLNNTFQIRRPPKFVLDSTWVDAPGGFYTLYFNKYLDPIGAKKEKNYDIIFKGRKFPIKRVEVFENSVRLFFKITSKTLNNSMLELITATNKRMLTKDLIDVRVKDIKDEDGNVVNQPDIQEYKQFREFFIQRIKPDSVAPTEGQFINKSKPIFADQPAIRPKNYDEFWMNTPLKKIGQ